MLLPNGDPRKRVTKCVTWARIKWPKDKSFAVNAWLAGPIKWVLCHHKGVSKPCRDELTKGAIKCHLCMTHPNVSWVGYVPLYDESGKTLFTQVKDSAYDIVSRIQPFDAVRVMRGGDQFDSISVTPSKWSARYQPNSDARREPAQMDSFLLRLWVDEELIKFFTQVPRTDVERAYDKVVEKREEAEDAGRKLLEKIRDRIKVTPMPGGDTVPAVGDVLPGPDGVPAPGRNGRHHHRPRPDDDG
jgi:hypothetical protein